MPGPRRDATTPPGDQFSRSPRTGRVDLRIDPALLQQHAQSDLVQSLGDRAANAVDGPARRNVTGPEAQYQRRVRASTQRTVADIRADELQAARLPAGSPQRRAIERGIATKVRVFRNTLAADTVSMGNQVRAERGQSGLDAFKSRLPSYLQDCIDRRGVVIPGVPGAITPRTDNGVLRGPSGLNWGIRW